MLSRTHGQTATPTTLGKEFANVAVRLAQARARIAAVALPAKMNGAVGNYNAHLAAYPEFDWEAFSRRIVEERLGLAFNPLHDPDRAARRHRRAVRRGQALRHDPDRLVRATPGATSASATSRRRPRRARSARARCRTRSTRSTSRTPRATSASPTPLLAHLSEKLPISRFQRDLTDSTVLRNMGVGARPRGAGARLARPRHGQARRRPRRRSTPTSTPPGRCWPSRCRR